MRASIYFMAVAAFSYLRTPLLAATFPAVFDADGGIFLAISTDGVRWEGVPKEGVA